MAFGSGHVPDLCVSKFELELARRKLQCFQMNLFHFEWGVRQPVCRDDIAWFPTNRFGETVLLERERILRMPYKPTRYRPFATILP